MRAEVARDLLRSAACDLAESDETQRSYQDAVLAAQKGAP